MTTTQQAPTAAPPTAPAPSRAGRRPSHQPARPVTLTLLSVLAVATSTLALSPLLEAGRWAPIAVLVCLALGLGTAAARTRVRSALAVTVGALVLLLYGLCLAYLSPPEGLGLLPDGATLERLGLLLRAAQTQVLEGVAPVPVSPALEMLTILGVATCYLVVELVCFGLRAPAWSAVPLLALWAPATTVYVEVSALTFALAALSFLMLLALTHPTAPLPEEERRRQALTTSGWAACVVALTLAVTPVVMVLPGWGRSPLPVLGSGGPGSVLLSADLDVRESLGRQSGEVALRYRAEPVTPGPLRLRTLRDFDGATWDPTSSSGPFTEVEPGDLLWPGGYEGETTGAAVTRMEVEIGALREQELPLPPFPRILDAPGRWAYDEERDEVVGRAPTVRGMTYTMDVVLPWYDADDLRQARAGTSAELEDYLAVPSTPHVDDIVTRALEVAEGAATDYDKALALQTYLRSRPFVYSTTVPEPVTGDAVWDFLQSGQGYCVQFATAMTVMSRALGIPARMAVGFLPGQGRGSGRDRVYEVRGDRAHTWPELYFEGIGWVRFEPTPAEQSGFPPSYADPFANEEEDPQRGRATPTALPTPTTAPPSAAPTAGASRGGAVGSTIREAPTWALALAVLALVLLVAALVVVVRRLRRRARARLDPEAAWRQLRRALAALGITWSDARTPRQVVVAVSEQLQRRIRTPLDPEVRRALEALASAVERLRYAPAAPQTPHEDLERDLARVIQATAVPGGEGRSGRRGERRSGRRGTGTRP